MTAAAVMKKDSFLRKCVEVIRTRFKPEKVILFGSAAEGRAGREVDYDILVLMDTDLKGYKQATAIRMALESE
ncbi:MAG: nucleotidyltransferase domain-containing protein [Candidatus Wallbacteria bacterium]|nr:nucleotidyltransferase domain-containing protein [Candidatus Wallbacteria bacterium]